jgi:hypothetical protein
MNTADADPGNPSSPDEPWDGQQPQDLLPGQLQAHELELDAYGVPVQTRPTKGRAYLVAAGGLICGGVTAWLAVMDVRAKLPGYLVALGILLGVLSGVPIVLLLYGDEKWKRKQLGRVIIAMIGAGVILGFLGMLVISGSHCGNNCGGGG